MATFERRIYRGYKEHDKYRAITRGKYQVVFGYFWIHFDSVDQKVLIKNPTYFSYIPLKIQYKVLTCHAR